jgi:hypothetical protein
MRSLALCALAACSFPTKELVGYDCMSTAAPTTAPNSVLLAGNAYDRYTPAEVSGAQITAYRTVDPTHSLYTATSGADGNFAGTLMLGGIPFEGYAAITAAGYVDTYVFSSTAIVADTMFGSVEFQPATVANLSTRFGTSIDMTKAQLLVVLNDCDDMGIEDAQVATNPAAPVFYLSNYQPAPAGTAATDNTGAAILLNVPAGPIHVTATSGSVTLQVDVIGFAGAFTEVLLSPQR